MRVALLGGSFDPVHNTHVNLALTALQHLNANEVHLIPAAQPWQRSALGASAEHRLAMLKLAVLGRQGLKVNPIEIERGGPTYTLDTLRALEPGPDYIWILGSDQLRNFCTWNGWQEILRYVTLAVAPRPGSTPVPASELLAFLKKTAKPLHYLPIEPSPISSSEIRERLQHGQDVHDFLPEAVWLYIQQHRLYINTD